MFLSKMAKFSRACTGPKAPCKRDGTGLLAAGGKIFRSHCRWYGIPWSGICHPTLTGWDGPTCVVCGMGMGREAGMLSENGHHMGIQKNPFGTGRDYCVIGGWRDTAGLCGIPTWESSVGPHRTDNIENIYIIHTFAPCCTACPVQAMV